MWGAAPMKVEGTYPGAVLLGEQSAFESIFSGMDKQTGIKHLRARGLDAVGYWCPLSAIGVNLFRAPGSRGSWMPSNQSLGGFTVICSIIGDVKEHFLSPWRRFKHVFKSAIENMLTPSELPRNFYESVKIDIPEIPIQIGRTAVRVTQNCFARVPCRLPAF